MEDGAADVVLLYGDELEPGLHRRQRSPDAGRASAHYEDIVCISGFLLFFQVARDVFDGLTALGDGVSYQAHAAELACYEHALDIGLEVRRDIRDVHAALFIAEDQRDGPDRAGRGARAVSDAVRGVYERAPAGDEAQDILLRAGLDARGAADAQRGVYLRMERRRLFVEAELDRLLELGLRLAGLLSVKVDVYEDRERYYER